MAIINGTSGSDNLVGTIDGDTINGYEGDDVINAKTRPAADGSPIDVVNGGAGIDTLIVDASAETLSVTLIAAGNPHFLVRSTSGNFFVDGYSIEKVGFTGGSGDDSINTADGGVLVNGGGGIDHWLADYSAITSKIVYDVAKTTAIAAAGLTSILNVERITLTTGSGNDRITGGDQADTITTGDGNDVINAKTRPTDNGAPIDVVNGGAGTDTLIVKANAETQSVTLIAAGNPHFLVRSTSGNFYVDGYSIEKVKFTGGNGDDSIAGGDSRDILSGKGGSDTINGDGGNDKLTGGSGNDRFVFANNFGKDVITDFSSANGEDIDLSAVTAITDFTDLVSNHLQTDTASGFAMIVDGANSILLRGITEAEIGSGLAYSDADFVF